MDKKFISNSKFLLCLITILIVQNCSRDNYKMELTFSLNTKEGIVPSNQIAIWLESPEGKVVKTLFVCNYLSYGGFTLAEICPDWTNKVDWSNTPKEIVDAVSQATPDIGAVQLKFDWDDSELPNGSYNYFIEIHIAENYNELYKGEIVLSGKGIKIVSEPHVTYLPEKHPKAGGLLSNVSVVYKN